jgi:aspartate/methionine/tyrosine aminotransferase
MTPETLSRPLAARVAGLPDAAELAPGPDLPPGVIAAAEAALDAGKTKYTDRPGILPLRARVAKTLKARYGLPTQPDDVTITCGSTEARFVALKKLATPGAPLLCPGEIGLIAGAAALVGVPVVTEVSDPAAIGVVYLAASLPQTTVAPLISQARVSGWWIIWDMSQNPDADFHPAQHRDLAPRVVTVGSLSAVLPGWRVGWLAGSERVEQLRAYKQSMTICSPSVSQWAALGWVEA